MSFFNSHLGVVYFSVTVIQILAQVVIAIALVSVARSLKISNRKEK